MKNTNPHWTFYAEVLSRSLKDIEIVCTASPDSSEFIFLREEMSDIVVEAREALSALESHLRSVDPASSPTARPPTQH
jgi:hypothetical protein